MRDRTAFSLVLFFWCRCPFVLSFCFCFFSISVSFCLSLFPRSVYSVCSIYTFLSLSDPFLEGHLARTVSIFSTCLVYVYLGDNDQSQLDPSGGDQSKFDNWLIHQPTNQTHRSFTWSTRQPSRECPSIQSASFFTR